MAIRKMKPMSAGSRFVTYKTGELTKGAKVEESLLTSVKKTGGRNAQGKITVRNIGGANRRKYRIIDFKRNKDGIVAKVDSIQYDPNRTAYIALLVYADGEKRYIIAPKGLNVGDRVMSGAGAEIKAGNALELKDIPLGAMIHNIELQPGKGGQLVRSAGLSAQLMAKEGKYATLRLPSGEMRKVFANCRATIGEIGNEENEIVSLGKAGRKRHMGAFVEAWLRPRIWLLIFSEIARPAASSAARLMRYPEESFSVDFARLLETMPNIRFAFMDCILC